MLKIKQINRNIRTNDLTEIINKFEKDNNYIELKT